MIIHIFRYSQLIDTDRMRTIKAFAEKSGLPEEVIGKIAITEEKKGGLISQYKSGGINSKVFRAELNNVILQQDGKPLEDSVFDNCWNAMCVVNSEKLSELYHLQLKHEDCKIHIIGDTNELQHKYIGEQIALLPEKPKIAYTLSFKEGTSNREELKKLAESLYSLSEEIVCHYTDQNSDGLKLLQEYYANEDSSLLQHYTPDKVEEGNNITEESNKTPDENTVVDVVGELSSNSDSAE